MTKRQLIDICLQCGNVYEDYPFDTEFAVVRHVANKKSFAFVYQRNGLCINLKVNPLEGELLRENFDSIQLGYHMNKRHWITVRLDGDVNDIMLKKLISNSFDLTASKVKHRIEL